MSDTESEPQEQEETAEEAGETSERAEKIAHAILIAVALLAAWGLVAAMPEIAYVVTGILLCLGWQKARARLDRREHDDQDQEPEEADEVDVAAALRKLAADIGGSVLLTALRDHLRLPDTKPVKALLDEAGIPYKGVRTPLGNGPGVHVKDIPPAPSSADDPNHKRCCCRSDDNNNADNTPESELQKGTRVEAIGDGGRLVSNIVDRNIVDRFFDAAACRNRLARPPGDD